MVPDIGVFGEWTYMVTIVFWGAIAFALLYRAERLRKAAITIVVLYPIGYVWDWYTLTVGVFEIRMHLGIELLGIPLEEHFFIIVVPALVIAVHETVHGELRRRHRRDNL